MITQNQELALRESEDPYAYYNIVGDPEEPQQSVAMRTTLLTLDQPRDRGISKHDFQNECRRVLLQYVPIDEGRVLRPHYRDFITRNARRSSGQRSRLVLELRKYDISSSGNLKPHFNRERELFTVSKLQQIETAALAGYASE